MLLIVSFHNDRELFVILRRRDCAKECHHNWAGIFLECICWSGSVLGLLGALSSQLFYEVC